MILCKWQAQDKNNLISENDPFLRCKSSKKIGQVKQLFLCVLKRLNLRTKVLNLLIIDSNLERFIQWHFQKCESKIYKLHKSTPNKLLLESISHTFLHLQSRKHILRDTRGLITYSMLWLVIHHEWLFLYPLKTTLSKFLKRAAKPTNINSWLPAQTKSQGW